MLCDRLRSSTNVVDLKSTVHSNPKVLSLSSLILLLIDE
jgi:hypothetical protein